MSFVPSSLDFSAVLFDTLLWTAALIALVLVLRRPVTRWFGAPAAYALWILPMLRLFLPPIELPAWLAPAKEVTPEASEAAATPLVLTFDAAAPAAVEAAPVEETTSLIATLSALPLTEIALTAWLGGGAVFLFLRFNAYFRLRDELTRDAVEVGTTKGPLGTIRLIETPNTNGPLAFGVMEPVIALPPGFMASVDRDARDLALAHELEHHRGHDLLINILAQPLFALHWFNPLGRYGWLALRRDQEAACDARVMANASRDERAIYAKVIASFAAAPDAAPKIALTAPMACPVLGDKSIIQRLRNLKMNDDASNTKSRKMASRLMLGTAVLALPLTASVTYAESLVPAPLAPPAATAIAPAAPTAPLVTALAQAAPEAPEAPEAPKPTEAREVEREVTIITVDPDTGKTKTLEFEGEDSELATLKVKGKDVIVMRKVFSGDDLDDLEDLEELKDLEDLKNLRSEFKRIKVINRGQEMDEAEMEAVIKEMREGLKEAREAAKVARLEIETLENSEVWKARFKEGEGRTFVTMSCDSTSDDVASTFERDDGTTEVKICQSRVMSHALKGLEQARAAIAENPEISGKMRKEILKELDQQIKSWRKDAR